MKKIEEYSYEAHQWVSSKGLGKHYCVKCGLINLTNPLTQWCVDKGCHNALHAQYRSVILKHTKQFK